VPQRPGCTEMHRVFPVRLELNIYQITNRKFLVYPVLVCLGLDSLLNLAKMIFKHGNTASLALKLLSIAATLQSPETYGICKEGGCP